MGRLPDKELHEIIKECLSTGVSIRKLLNLLTMQYRLFNALKLKTHYDSNRILLQHRNTHTQTRQYQPNLTKEKHHMTAIRKNTTKTTIAEFRAVRAALEYFYHAVIVPDCKSEGTDPMKTLNAVVRYTVRFAEQAQLDANRSAYFTLPASGSPYEHTNRLSIVSMH